MKKGFICIIGIDGSGKSTLANRLISKLNKNDGRFKYVWCGCEHYLTWPFVFIGQKLFLGGLDRFDDYDEYQEKIQETAKSGVISRIYHTLLLLDYFLQILFRIRLPLFLGKGIISDRYAHDVLINLAVNLGYNETQLKNSLKKFLSICPEPDLMFLIDIPEEIAFQRKDDIPSIEYLRARKGFYLSIAEDYNMIVLDGSKTIEEIEDALKTYINNYL
jgi:dTMP kinase